MPAQSNLISEPLYLKYDSTKWKEVVSKPLKTLQLFITNNCNLRCKGCFYVEKLEKSKSASYMNPEQYCDLVKIYKNKGFERVTILGGEPTLHPDLFDIIDFNTKNGLKTTVYTNGRGDNKRLVETGASIRIGVHGIQCKDKPLVNITDNVPFLLVLMLNTQNTGDLNNIESYVSDNIPKVKDFYLSSIREIDKSGDFWLDTPMTLSNHQYADIVQNFVENCGDQFKRLHISTRGVLTTDMSEMNRSYTCRFCNVFPNGKKTICPLDISLNKYDDDYIENRGCSKSKSCVLQKIVLERI